MDGCLLCLEIIKEFENCIKVNSVQWLELKIQSIIEKHFWSIETSKDHTSVCSACWQELYDFHKFYKRIEQAHVNLGKFMKIEDESEIIIEAGRKDGFVQNMIGNDPVIHQNLEPEVLLIKEENPLEQMLNEDEEEQNEEDKPLRQRQKRQCTAKTKAKKSPSKKVLKGNKTNTIKKCKDSTSKPSTSLGKIYSNEMDLEENGKFKSETADSVEITHDQNISKSSNDNDETNSNYYNNDHDEDEINSESDQESNGNTPNQKRIDSDNFISANIQLYCHLCQMQFDNFTPLLKHFLVEHKRRGYAMCCKKKLMHRSDIVDHIHVHKNPEHFKCNVCGKILADRHCLRVHIRKLHEGVVAKPFECEICGKILANKHCLQVHKYTIHEVTINDRETCTECNRTFDGDFLENKCSSCIEIKKENVEYIVDEMGELEEFIVPFSEFPDTTETVPILVKRQQKNLNRSISKKQRKDGRVRTSVARYV